MGVEGGKAMEEKEKLFCRIFLPLAWSGHIGLGLALGESLEHLAIIILLLEYVVPSLLLLSVAEKDTVQCLFRFTSPPTNTLDPKMKKVNTLSTWWLIW